MPRKAAKGSKDVLTFTLRVPKYLDEIWGKRVASMRPKPTKQSHLMMLLEEDLIAAKVVTREELQKLEAAHLEEQKPEA